MHHLSRHTSYLPVTHSSKHNTSHMNFVTIFLSGSFTHSGMLERLLSPHFPFLCYPVELNTFFCLQALIILLSTSQPKQVESHLESTEDENRKTPVVTWTSATQNTQDILKFHQNRCSHYV